jgi:dTDP-glucose 4,6-dehydratase
VPKTILITGAAGFIGSNFVRLLLRSGEYDYIRILDALTYAGNLDNLAGCLDDPRVKFIQGDIANSEAARRAMRGCNAVVHFAAETHVDRSLSSADPFLHTNVLGTYVLLETARESDIGKFLHISTDEVYGPMIEDSAKEDYPFNPSSPYSASKVAAEAMVNAYRVSFGIPTVVVRPANNYGPYQFPEKLIPFFVKRAVEGKSLPVYGEGLQVRDWLHVEDNCRAILLALREGKSGDVFNIGTDNHHKNIEITRRIIEILGLGEDRIEYVTDRLGHDFRYAVDSTKIRNLGWRPEIPFDKGFKDTVLWFARQFGG